MSTDIKLVEAQLSRIIQLGGLLGKTLGNVGKKLLDLVVTLTKDVLPKLATKATSFVLDKFDKKNKWTRYCKRRKNIYFIHIK